MIVGQTKKKKKRKKRKIMSKMAWLIDKFTKYVSGSMYVSIHCFKIDAGISSFPGAEFFNVLITVMISFFGISGI